MHGRTDAPGAASSPADTSPADWHTLPFSLDEKQRLERLKLPAFEAEKSSEIANSFEAEWLSRFGRRIDCLDLRRLCAKAVEASLLAERAVRVVTRKLADLMQRQADQRRKLLESGVSRVGQNLADLLEAENASRSEIPFELEFTLGTWGWGQDLHEQIDAFEASAEALIRVLGSEAPPAGFGVAGEPPDPELRLAGAIAAVAEWIRTHDREAEEPLPDAVLWAVVLRVLEWHRWDLRSFGKRKVLAIKRLVRKLERPEPDPERASAESPPSGSSSSGSSVGSEPES